MRTSLKRENAKNFLKNVVDIYNSPYGFPKLENFAKNYKGDYKRELSKIMKYLYSANTGGNSRVLGLNVSDLEQILDKANCE